jgi:hypothetical protein
LVDHWIIPQKPGYLRITKIKVVLALSHYHSSHDSICYKRRAMITY